MIGQDGHGAQPATHTVHTIRRPPTLVLTRLWLTSPSGFGRRDSQWSSIRGERRNNFTASKLSATYRLLPSNAARLSGASISGNHLAVKAIETQVNPSTTYKLHQPRVSSPSSLVRLLCLSDRLHSFRVS
jgi:hypothetical protein